MKFTPRDIAETALRMQGKYSDVAYVQIIEEMINNLLNFKLFAGKLLKTKYMKTAKEIFEKVNGFSLIGDNETISLTKRNIFEAMEEYAVQSKFGKWIKVSEQLPKRDVVVIICNTKDFQYRCIGYVDEEGQWWKGITKLQFVTHWMPMPDLPSVEKV